ncbi:putative bifunctional diguanylate cyclase/phosphodiesterase [Virgisporangium aurantiacum]|uniref:Diguanylate cyclase (GGDEF) domain-containing protein n=1 Tax=Virgisporangium aurantiacum TaxID=175570 RepID=A0A8J4DYD3_9ACTN|nr:EAL domain-containing protein [Virgisporangium aurantiacum]GIJ54789.1 hypothetical protein Vau01_023050 [Virgisporangium aurantiacum]
MASGAAARRLAGLFRPAAVLLGRLRYIRKFVLVGLVLLVPLGFVAGAYVDLQRDQIDFSAEERHGVVLMAPLVDLTGVMVAARAEPAADTPCTGPIDGLLNHIDALDRRLGTRMRTSRSWGDARHLVVAACRTDSLPVRRAAFDMAMEALLKLIVRVGDESNLTLDPDIDTYYLMDTLQFRLPKLLDVAGRAAERADRVVRTGSTVDYAGGVDAVVDLGRNLGVITDINSALTRAATAVVDSTGSASVRLGARDGYERLAEVVDAFSRSLQRATAADRFEEVAEPAAAVRQEASRLAGWVATTLDERLRARISGFTTRALRVSIGSGAAGLLAGYLFVGFYLSVARPIRRIVDTLDAVAHGDLTRRASVDTHDELAFVAHALNDTIARTEAATNRLSIRATHDALTGLPNRSHMLTRLGEILDRSASTGELVCVIFVDLDRFKIVNDSLGHEAGDQVLRAVTARITAFKRTGDTVARLAGDEFVVICEGLTSVDGAVGIAERIVDRVCQPISVQVGTTVREVSVGASVGIALNEGITDAEPDDLIRAADMAMYQAKQRGRGRVEVFDDRLRAAMQERADAHHDLRRAIDAGELHAHYQPFMSVATGRVVGVEASARWHHPRRGVLDTAEFSTIAEEDGLVGPIGAVILRQACRQAAEWRAIHTDLHVAVKVSGTQLADPTFVATLSDTLDETGLDAAALWLAVTETSLGAGADATGQTLDDLRDLGVRIVIDNFGTGHSSLVQLPRLPVDAVKVDRTFVTGIGRPDDEIVIAMIVALCRTLGLFVVADGVETDDQLRRLRELGCDAIQGPWYGRPTPADQVRFGEPVATH